MELSSHVTANLDQWVEDGFITCTQREVFAQLLASACIDSRNEGYEIGYDAGVSVNSSDSYDEGYDDGWDRGFEEANLQLTDSLKQEWFQQGWAEACLEHGIEE